MVNTTASDGSFRGLLYFVAGSFPIGLLCLVLLADPFENPMSQHLARLLTAGARLNQNNPLRNGNMICFPGKGDLIITGDLHNHRRNFERIQTLADLGNFPDRHVILHEIVHGGILDREGCDRSLDMLLEAIEWADEYPGQVHFLLANHDLAQVYGQAIMKEGYDLTDRFTRYFTKQAGGGLDAANGAFHDFILTMPLAAITFTGILLSHSLPGPRDMATFDRTILRRELTEADLSRTGSVYQLVWGRSQDADSLAQLAKAWWCETFVCGHQAQDSGYATINDRMLILDSSHNHGVYLPVDLARPYTFQELVARVQPLAAIA